MKTKFIFPFLLVFFNTTLYGQNTFFVGQNSYPASETFSLHSPGGGGVAGPHEIETTFAKKDNQVLLILSTYSYMRSVGIKGNILLYLEDGTVIKCIDRGIKDMVNDKATTVYYLTEKEVSQLQKSNLRSIRYSRKCISCISSPMEGDYTASNIAEKNELLDNLSSSNLNIQVSHLKRNKKADVPSILNSLNL